MAGKKLRNTILAAAMIGTGAGGYAALQHYGATNIKENTVVEHVYSGWKYTSGFVVGFFTENPKEIVDDFLGDLDSSNMGPVMDYMASSLEPEQRQSMLESIAKNMKPQETLNTLKTIRSGLNTQYHDDNFVIAYEGIPEDMKRESLDIVLGQDKFGRDAAIGRVGKMFKETFSKENAIDFYMEAKELFDRLEKQYNLSK